MSDTDADKILEQTEVEETLSEKIEKSKPAVLKPTRRFFARVLDLILVSALLAPVVYFGDLWHVSIKDYIIVQLMVACLFFVYDLLMTFIFGATAGKMLAGLGVTKDTGERISFAGAVKRSFLLLVVGLGLLIPPVTIAATTIAYLKARKQKKLIWEKGNRTYAHSITALRCMWSTLLVVAIAAVFCIPIAVNLLTLVPHTGDITPAEFAEDYDAIQVKYLKSVSDAAREYDPAFYDENKLYNADGFRYITDDAGIVKGFIYTSIAVYDDKYTTEERDLVIIGIASLISSDRSNRGTYNVSLESFTRIFEFPFQDHDITAGGVRVVHSAVPQNDGYLVTYTVTFADYEMEVSTDESM